MNVISAYAPPVGCEMEEKEEFWRELHKHVLQVPIGERMILGADFNGHVGEGNNGDEEAMGMYRVKERNTEGQMVIVFAKRIKIAIVNTYLKKKEENRVTYKSGGRSTQVDYILCRRRNRKKEGEKDLYSLARQRNRDEQDVQQVKMINDKDGNVLSREESVLGRWKEYFEESRE
ncbi:uncharacterized protein LOC136085214 [Hydra vulgaris]|uniref:Uncharacterized protein LOC136085214 n=1 Tax=Hydra vulgaris TaxID=6087 RepID=A0ABM4CLB9_HYDVU